MSTQSSSPLNLTLPQLFARFPDEVSAIVFLEEMLWNGVVTCPHCNNNDQSKFWIVTANKAKKVRVGLRACAVCKKQFRVTVGTIFEDSHLPLNTWLIAWYLLCGAKKGMSALQLMRHLGIGSYRTAWFMAHRIRHSMQETFYPEQLKGTVEVDECYFGPRGPKQYKVLKTDTLKHRPKSAVIALVERSTGERRSVVREHLTRLSKK